MAGIYIHIPYCKKKCIYCDFYFKINTKDTSEMVYSICKELENRKHYLNNESIDSIYFGGGTPSILPVKDLKKIKSIIYNNYPVNKNAEVTLEANPDDLTKKNLTDFISLGINRLSVGVQSFNEEDLVLMNRSHSKKQALECISSAQEIGFKNISVDLIYGLPKQTLKHWENNLNVLFDLKIQHFSAYLLTVEKNTRLFQFVKSKKITMLEDDLIISQFYKLSELAEKNNFIQYEISNFAKENLFSNHNTSYWQNKKFLGVGPSAHSFNKLSRRWNVSSNKNYIEKIAGDNIYFEEEKLNKKQKYNEYILTNLRTIWGINLNEIEISFGKEFRFYINNMSKKWIVKKFIRLENEKILLTKKGKIFVSNIFRFIFYLKYEKNNLHIDQQCLANYILTLSYLNYF